MFCPKCASQNVDGASYCRSCGANISLVPQALTGQLGAANQDDDESCMTGRGFPSRENAVRGLTMGVAFAAMLALTGKFFISSGLVAGGGRWPFWLLLPAIISFSWGFSQIPRLRRNRKQTQAAAQTELNSVRPFDLPANKTAELRTAVPSVTEGTTRHLAGVARTRQLDSPDQRPS